MQIAMKSSSTVVAAIIAPYIHTSGGWVKPIKVFIKTAATTWNEVWPGTVTYTHEGTDYIMNIAACFGYPTMPSGFVFVNNGTIGGGIGAAALTTGSFPAGSTLTIINNGYIQGAGGMGGGDPYTPNTPGQPGSPAIALQFPTIIQNNGYIFGGGGGGAPYYQLDTSGGGGNR